MKANTKYNDMVGTVSADRSDVKNLITFLKVKGLAEKDEAVGALRVDFFDNFGKDVNDLYVEIKLIKRDGVPEDSVLARSVGMLISLSEFLSFFKRFDLVLTRNDIDGLPFEEKNILFS